MPLEMELEAIPGARELYDWFGYWPSFHDAEVIYLHLNRSGLSSMAVHIWDTTNELDAQGCYVMRKHVVVNFLMDDILDLQLDGFNHQNVIRGLRISKKAEGFELVLDPCYGVAGSIVAGRVELKITPGEPA